MSKPLTPIHRSAFPDRDIPDTTLSELILTRARQYRDHLALIEPLTGRTLTYAQFADQVEQTAAGLPEGKIALACLPNSIDFAIFFYAVAHRGGATTTMNPALTEREMARQIEDARPAYAFTTEDAAPRLNAAGAAKVMTHLPARTRHRSTRAQPPPTPQDLVALPYSSGTAGAPKGVVLTHRNLVANLVNHDAPIDKTGPQDVTLAFLPFFHIYGLSMILTLALARGATLVILPRFELDTALQAIQQHRVTRLPLVPPLVLRLAREPKTSDYDLSSLQVVYSGAAPLAPELHTQIEAKLSVNLKQGYGMTELSPGSHMHPETGRPAQPGTVGQLVANTDAQLSEMGEIWIRGPQVMAGYLNKPDETRDTLTEDGWLRTGDIGTVDEAGNWSIVDRLKEMIKYKGFQVAPAELEALLLTHPDVLDAAVIGVKDEEAGEIPKAFIVPRPNGTRDPQALQDWVATQVAPYKRIRALEFIDEVPKSPSGKILRRLLG